MYLKRLTLHGFKSFAPRTTLEFSPGITAIVGPNGAGKSNISDGIRWVLGEQSMRQLRGKKSDDVIFAGGTGRATAQMAEVGLVLDNSAGWLPSEFTEVTVSRRNFRSGETEYLLNGQRGRLRDVLLLLAQARIGHDSYTVIGQGLVDQALSARAEERRALFEDAAGIRQFQVQRTEAEQKLALTQSNLARLADIIGEIEPRLAPLAEQARRAREFTGTQAELTRLLRQWYRRQWHELRAQLERAQTAEQALASQMQQTQERLAEREAALAGLRRQREAVLLAIANLRRERGEVSGQLQTRERDLAVARERMLSLDRQQGDIAAEQDQQEAAIASAREHVAQLEAQITAVEEKADATTLHLEALERAQHAARQNQEREEARLRAAQREVMQAQARLGAAQSELGRLQRQLGERNRMLAARAETATEARRKLEQADALLAERREAFEALRRLVEEHAAGREERAAEMTAGNAEIERLRSAVADAERDRRALNDRLALLEEWRRNLEGNGEGVRALLQNAADEGHDVTRPQVLGVVGQLIGAPAGMESAVEAALGVFLHAVAVATSADAQKAADWLRGHGGERALFVWVDGASSSPQRSPRAAPSPDGRQHFGYVRDAIQCEPRLHAALARILGDMVIVRELPPPDQRGSLPLMTLSGELWHPDGWMRGGGSEDAASAGEQSSVLARERELRSLPTEIERRTAEIAELKAQHERAVALQGERKAHDEELRGEAQRLEASAQEAARALTNLQRERERVASDAQLSAAVAEQLVGEIEGLDQEVAATTARVDEAAEAQRVTTEQVEEIQAEVDDVLAEGRKAQEALSRARTSAAVEQQEVKALSQRADQARAQLSELELQVARRGERLAAFVAQRGELTSGIGEHEQTIVSLRQRIAELGEKLRAGDGQQAELDGRIGEQERAQVAEQQELTRLDGERQRIGLDAQRGSEALEMLATQIREELGAEGVDDPLPGLLGEEDDVNAGPAQRMSAEELAKLRRQIDGLRAKLRNLGGYDPDAPNAYEELKTRYDFLTSQVRDMEQAAANLRQIIAELDATMRRQFEETFRAVNERFQRHFTVLFNGGAARLELTPPRRAQSDDEDGEEDAATGVAPKKPSFGGVEVYVQIPGKKVQDLTLLSGGERAMVSAALLFALLETNPPPFCLLDEVDAALDEANVVRFCQILQVLAEQTQFIVITHNRVTMTHADAIYGVSMGGDSVSRVLSLRLAEVASVS